MAFLSTGGKKSLELHPARKHVLMIGFTGSMCIVMVFYRLDRIFSQLRGGMGSGVTSLERNRAEPFPTKDGLCPSGVFGR